MENDQWRMKNDLQHPVQPLHFPNSNLTVPQLDFYHATHVGQ